jgi:hypothetical protein
MANNVANVTAGKPKVGGAIYVAPTGTTLPTDATTALDAAFVCLGYVSEDGLTRTITRESENVKAWGGDTVLTTQTEFTETFSFTLIETLNVDVKKVMFGDANVTGTLATGITTTSNSTELAEHAYAIEMVQNGATVRIVIPCGKVSELGDITYSDGEVVGYNPTLTALPDTSGNASYEYTVKP